MIEKLLPLDEALFYFLNTKRNPYLDFILPLFSNSILIYIYYFTLAIFLGFLWYKRGLFSLKKYFLVISFLIIGFLVTDLICARVWKPLFQRERPYTQLPNMYYYSKGNVNFLEKPIQDKKTLGFPSCHAANVSFASTYLVFFMKDFFLPSFLFVILVCYSRIYLGHHYPLDVLGGILWGVFLAWVIYKNGKKILV